MPSIDLLSDSISDDEKEYLKNSETERTQVSKPELEIVEEKEQPTSEPESVKDEKIVEEKDSEKEIKQEQITEEKTVVDDKKIPEKEQKKEEVKEVDISKKTVPLAALKEAREKTREKTKALQEETKKHEEFKKVAQERLDKLLRKLQEPEVKVEDDINAALLQKTEKLELKQQINEEVGQINQTQNDHVSKIERAVVEEERAFSQITPDYGNAVDYLRSARAAEYKMMYPGIMQAQLDQALYNEAIQVSQQAIQNGDSPAEVFYKLAKGRGYVAVVNQQETTTKEDDKQVTQSGKDTPSKLAEKQLKTISEGQKTTKRPGGGSGSPTEELSLEDIVNMSDEDFDKVSFDYLKKNRIMS